MVDLGLLFSIVSFFSCFCLLMLTLAKLLTSRQQLLQKQKERKSSCFHASKKLSFSKPPTLKNRPVSCFLRLSALFSVMFLFATSRTAFKGPLLQRLQHTASSTSWSPICMQWRHPGSFCAHLLNHSKFAQLLGMLELLACFLNTRGMFS